MARDTDNLAGFESDNTGGLLTGFLAEEDVFDRRALWRLGSWGAASVGAVVVAVMASQSPINMRRDQLAAADLARQSQQIQLIARESENEARRLASAIDTLNGDRDRLYSRVTVLEQGLDSVTGAIARQSAPVSAQAAPSVSTTSTAAVATERQPEAPMAAPAPAVAPVASTPAKTAEKPPMDAAAPAQGPATVAAAAMAPAVTPATPLMASKSIMAPPDAAAGKLIQSGPPSDVTVGPIPEVTATVPDEAETEASQVAVLRTEFGVDVGGANSVDGLRALWRGLLKSRSNAALTTLRPIMVVKENSTGLGMQLRLVAGPLNDAAAAAKICAAMLESQRPCETTVFDGQRLAIKGDEPAAAATKPAATGPSKPTTRPSARRRSSQKRVIIEEPAKKPDTPSTFSSLFKR